MISGDVALLLAILVGMLEIVSILVVNRKIDKEHDFMLERGTAGEQLGEWLVYREAEGEPTNIQVLTRLIASELHQTMKYSAAGKASVDARIQNKYDDQVMAALKSKVPVGYKILMRIAEELGFDLEGIIEADELGPWIASLNKAGVPLMMGESPNPSKRSKSGVFNIG